MPGLRVTPERCFANRREFLKRFGFAGGAIALGLHAASAADAIQGPVGKSGPQYPAPRSPEYDPKWSLSNERVFSTYNNFYEFSTQKSRVHRLVDKFVIEPWPVKIGGLCEKPMTLEAMELTAMFPLEERIYRFRCVEAWAAVVPWTGFPLAKLLEKVQPKTAAQFVKFQTAMRSDQMPGILRLPEYPWPYTEGLRLAEAMNPLTLIATGLYGKPLPKQNGAPIRLVVPWKYGYKSIKSIVSIELVEKQPATLWETLAPAEYPFESNVDPAVPHPRWSQASERMVDTEERVPTQKYNGYGPWVEGLYRR
jgi:sulfoxide reductase catalytic subunit YedY